MIFIKDIFLELSIIIKGIKLKFTKISNKNSISYIH
jgi:hypothetical protein